ncbi:hypothetical protein [Pararcticibacter amylolyticus]|uniref:Uncharacterized protein n=1 Tax=Pararcticibacter amylolyticus TaxID=2173175 RepID=A0A2U2PJP1_9SPHI|nr:hypothetical protein [Pararcticibacter amylolyticus]PWG81600.1 hypothetical protein DDR33_07150 [Pararcticibacter amylolyticus]
MQEVTVKFKSAKTLEALLDLAKKFDMVIETKVPVQKKRDGDESQIPITFAEHPDVTTLAGIRKGREINPDDLREKAWGGRL